MDFTHLWSSEGGAPGPDEWISRTYDVGGSLLCDSNVSTFNIIWSRTTSGNSNAATVSTYIRRTCYPLQVNRIWTYTVGGAESSLFFNTDGTLEWQETSGSTTVSMKSSNVFYDNAGWYHIVVRLDTTQSTASNRLRMYVNGKEVTYATQNAMTQNSTPKLCTGSGELQWNSNGTGFFRLGVSAFAEGSHEPTAFGQYDGLGQWRPKEPSVTWGSNDGYWKFMSSATMQDDSSGNGNNLSLSGGNTSTSNPSNTFANRFQLDSPTSVRGQKSYMAPYLTRVDYGAFRDYNGSSAQDYAEATHGLQYGGAYRVEFQTDSISGRNAQAGSRKADMYGNGSSNGYWWRQAHGDAGETLVYRFEGGYYDSNGSYGTIATSQEANTLDSQSCLTGFRYFSWSSGGVATWTTDESLGATANINLYDTGSKRGCQAHLDDGDLPIVTDPGYWDIAMLNHRWYSNSATTTYMASNFGCGPFYRAESHFNYGPYTPPKSDGHVNDSPVYDGKFYSNVLVGSGSEIKGLAEAWLGADDGLVIIKDRDNSAGAQVIDTKRGLNNALSMTSTSGSSTYSAPSGNSIAVCWKEVEGYKNGFEIVRYTGNGAASRDIAHNLNRRPCMIWIKAESTTSDWTAWYAKLGTNGSQKWTASDNSRVDNSNRTGGGFLATSSINNTNGIQFDSFRVGASSAALTDVNANGVNYVAYVWAPCEGYCSYNFATLGSYETLGSLSWDSNNFAHTLGFKPRFVLHIGPGGSSTAGYCYVQDTQRVAPNVGNCSSPLIDLWGTGTEIASTGWLWHANGLYNKNPSTSGHYLSGNSTWTLGFAEVPLWGKSCSPASPFS